MACELIPEVKNYIDLVRGETIPVCREQVMICDLVERAFQTESIRVDTEQLHKYLDMQKYFPFRLLSWEVFCFALHNCVYRADGQLRWPDLFIMVGRGAGKNGYLAFEDFCLLTPINGIKNYHIDICATSENQARTTFDDIYDILENERNRAKLQKHFYWTKEMIRNIKTGSILRFRTSNSKTADGGRPGKIDFDEKHAYEDYKLINVFQTGLGKKPFPRTTTTTTNGDVRDGPLDHEIARAMQILQEGKDDNGTLPFICRLDDPKEVDCPELWPKANPSLPYFPTLQRELEREYELYKLDPINNAAFMTKRMNLPRDNNDVVVTSWENIAATNRKIPDLTGCDCVAGVDYAKTTDFVSAGLLFDRDNTLYWITHTWVCKACPDLPRIKPPLRDWEAAGLLTFVDDVEVNPEIPAAWLQEMGEKYNILGLGIDLYRHTLLSRALREVGFNAEKGGNIKLVRPTDQMKIAPTIASAFANHTICWGDNPLMRWYTNNTKMVTSAAGNITYGKIEPKSRKTDGFMAFVAAMTIKDKLERQIYADLDDIGVFTY